MPMNNNMNFFNPMMNPNFININNPVQQIMQQQLIQQQQMMQQMDNTPKIVVQFHKRGYNPVHVLCKLNDFVSDIIKKYRKYSLDNDQDERFIFNAKILNKNLTVADAGLNNNSIVVVSETKGIMGG